MILSPIFASFTSIYFRTNFLTSTILFFGIPAIYLSLRNQNVVNKSIIFSLICGVIGSFIVDSYGILNQSWFVQTSVFSFRIGGVPIEDLIWGSLLTYNIVLFYEHFIDKGKHNLKDTKFKYLIIILLLILIIFTLFYLLQSSILVTKYAYLKLGIVVIFLPTISFLSAFPRLVSKFLKTGVYFFIQGLMFELTGITLNYWGFKDGANRFIGWVSFGSLKFPLEEFIFWMILFSTCVLSYYEFFDDDRR